LKKIGQNYYFLPRDPQKCTQKMGITALLMETILIFCNPQQQMEK